MSVNWIESDNLVDCWKYFGKMNRDWNVRNKLPESLFIIDRMQYQIVRNFISRPLRAKDLPIN